MKSGRSRASSGKFRSLRKDTQIGTIEKKYNTNFNTRSDMQLGTYLKKEGVPSLNKALKKLKDKR